MTVAVGLGRRGKRVALIEKDKVGGECTHTGCIPSKALIRAGHTNHAHPLQLVRDVILEVQKEEHQLLQSLATVELVSGSACFVDAATVSVTTATEDLLLSATHIVIATGARARKIEIPGLPPDKYFTTDTFFTLKKLPCNLVVVGGGAVACELACAAAQLGCAVSLVHRGTTVVKEMGSGISTTLENSMREQGISFHWEATDLHADAKNLYFKSGKNLRSCLCDAVLVVTGRLPNLEALSLEKAGIAYSEKGIEVDGASRTSVPSIFAIGDVTSRGGTTYLANEQGRQVVQQILAPVIPVHEARYVPKAIFTSPEVAQVGISATELALLSQDSYHTLTLSLVNTDRGKTDGLTTGFITLIAERVTGKLLQASVVAPHASEMISFFSVCLEQRISLWKLRNLIFPYPTFSQATRTLADQFMVETISNFSRDFLLLSRSKVKQLLKNHGLHLLAAGVWVVCILVVHAWFKTSGQTLSSLLTYLAQVSRNSALGPLLYSGLYFARPLTLLPASILTAAAGSLWGVQSGYVYALIAATLSSLLPYAFGRWWSKDSRGVQQFQRFFSSNGFESVLMLRFLFFPYDAVSVAAGVMKVPLGSFLAATILGNTIGTLTFVSLGATLPLEDIAQGMVKFKLSSLLPSLGLALATVCVSQLVKRLIVRYKRSRHA